jgi:hypothetical protein
MLLELLCHKQHCDIRVQERWELAGIGADKNCDSRTCAKLATWAMELMGSWRSEVKGNTSSCEGRGENGTGLLSA